MMEKVLGPLPKHMIVRAEYVYKSFVIFLSYFLSFLFMYTSKMRYLISSVLASLINLFINAVFTVAVLKSTSSAE
jgi:hypothetical protein